MPQVPSDTDTPAARMYWSCWTLRRQPEGCLVHSDLQAQLCTAVAGAVAHLTSVFVVKPKRGGDRSVERSDGCLTLWSYGGAVILFKRVESIARHACLRYAAGWCFAICTARLKVAPF